MSPLKLAYALAPCIQVNLLTFLMKSSKHRGFLSSNYLSFGCVKSSTCSLYYPSCLCLHSSSLWLCHACFNTPYLMVPWMFVPSFFNLVLRPLGCSCYPSLIFMDLEPSLSHWASTTLDMPIQLVHMVNPE